MATVSVTNIPFGFWVEVATTEFICPILSTAVYPLNGISQVNSRFYFKVEDFNGDAVYKNPAFDSTPDYSTPDIAGSNPLTWLNETPVMPTNSAGEIIKGEYTCTVIQRDETQSVTDLFTESFSVDYQFTSPVRTLLRRILLFNPTQILITDITNYYITDPALGTQITTDVLTRAFSLYYPPSLQFSPITSTSSSISTYNVWSGNYEVELVSTAQYELTTTLGNCELRVLDAVTIIEDFSVPNTNMNQLYCCLKHAEDRYWDARGTQGETKAREVFQLCMAYNSLIGTAIMNGSYNDVTDYIERIKEIANCDDDCECDDDDSPQQLTGWGTQASPYIITEIASGTNASFPTATGDKNRLKNKTTEDFIFFDESEMVPSSVAAAYFTFNSSTGVCTLNYSPTIGNRITIHLLK